MDKKDNLNKLKTVISSIEKSYGKGSIMMLGKKDEDMGNVDVYSTGSLGLDIALGIGGLPKGRVVEVYGPESSGKTTLTLHVIAEGTVYLINSWTSINSSSLHFTRGHEHHIMFRILCRFSITNQNTCICTVWIYMPKLYMTIVISHFYGIVYSWFCHD